MTPTKEELNNAVFELEALVEKATTLNEDGMYDNAQRWYPSTSKGIAYCKGYRSPSRAFPWSYRDACSSIKGNVALGHISQEEATLVRSYKRAINHCDPLIGQLRVQEIAMRLKAK